MDEHLRLSKPSRYAASHLG